MKLHITPQPNQWPQRGGVREHLRQIYKQMLDHPSIELVDDPHDADVLHVESAYSPPIGGKPMVYVCHGGFVPSPIPLVMKNLEFADMIVSVADWLIEAYFPRYKWKTVTIHNGVCLSEFESLSDRRQNYILYAKEWEYYFDDFRMLAKECHNMQFVSTVWPGMSDGIIDNLTYIGLQSRGSMMSWLSQAKALMITGSEVCPTMLLEAWACRTPIIARNIDGSKELMTRTGEVVGGMLYNSISDLRGLPLRDVLEHSGELGQQGRLEVERLYQWKDLFEKYITVYERVLQ